MYLINLMCINKMTCFHSSCSNLLFRSSYLGQKFVRIRLLLWPSSSTAHWIWGKQTTTIMYIAFLVYVALLLSYVSSVYIHIYIYIYIIIYAFWILIFSHMWNAFAFKETVTKSYTPVQNCDMILQIIFPDVHQTQSGHVLTLYGHNFRCYFAFLIMSLVINQDPGCGKLRKIS